MFDTDRSASRGQMAARRLLVFKHRDALGNAPAHKLFERIKIAPSTTGTPTRSFDDYNTRITIDTQNLPEGVELIEKL
jgi:CRISPR-associated protein Csd2